MCTAEAACYLCIQFNTVKFIACSLRIKIQSYCNDQILDCIPFSTDREMLLKEINDNYLAVIVVLYFAAIEDNREK